MEGGKLLSDTACEETPGDDREPSPENEAEGERCTKVCLHSDFHIVCVCVSLAVRARIPNLQYGGACEPHTVSKGRMQFTFLCTCTGAARNKYQYLKIK